MRNSNLAAHVPSDLEGEIVLPNGYESNTPQNVRKFKSKEYDLSKLFIVKTANEFMVEAQKLPNPVPLFGTFWNENEICILFADTNLGKSILSVQIAKSLTEGKKPFENALDFGSDFNSHFSDPAPRKVLYFDFEMSKKQFQRRYTQDDLMYRFSENFLRVELNPACFEQADLPFEELVIQAIKLESDRHDCKTCIIDNLTYLNGEVEKAKDVIPFMKELNRLKKENNISFMIVAHTPKRSPHNPITINDLAGSKALGNFIDSSFAVGRSSKDSNIRYLKQIKNRDGEFFYHDGNIILCEITKQDSFLGFNVIGLDHEVSHLAEQTEEKKDSRNAKIKELHEQGKSLREIGNELGISYITVKRFIDKSKN